MQVVYELTYDKFTPISSEGEYVFRKYDRIKSFLKKYVSEDISKVLLVPKRENQIVAFLNESGEKLRSIEDFSSHESDRIIAIYNAHIYSLESKLNGLFHQGSLEADAWSRLLHAVFDREQNVILSDGNVIRLVWGWKLNHGRNYFLPLESVAHLMANIESVKHEEIANDIETSGKIEEGDTGDRLEDEGQDGVESIVEEPPIPSDISDVPTSPIEPIETPLKKRWYERSSFWWILFGILLFLVLCWFLIYIFNRDRIDAYTSEEIELIYANVLPDQPGFRETPIQKIDFVEDDLSNTIIVGNIINLALKEKSADFKKFIVELSGVIDKNGLSICYYDDITRRVQVSVPVQNREEMKALIRDELSGYSLLIWDESVFSSERKANDPGFKETDVSWHMDAMGVGRAWEKTMGCEDVVVAIIDDGFDLNHSELSHHIVKPYNVQRHDSIVNALHGHVHGTHVASLAIGEANNGIGLSGVAPNCSFMPIQASGVDDFFTSTDIIDGVLYAIHNGADVINLSLGRSFANGVGNLGLEEQKKLANSFGQDEAIFWDELFSMAERNNVFVVMAAGNDRVYAGLDPMRRSEKTLKVGAHDKYYRMADFSNFEWTATGNNDWVIAPGVMIFGAKPNDGFSLLDGTSMAAPLVSGGIALLKCMHPAISNREVFELIAKSNETNLIEGKGRFLRIDYCLKNDRL